MASYPLPPEAPVLELRPTCENCNRVLPPESTEAMICSFECTFCAPCVDEVLRNVCPNCGGGFTPRPIRPREDRKGGNSVGKFPPSQQVKHRPVDATAHEIWAAPLQNLPPESR